MITTRRATQRRLFPIILFPILICGLGAAVVYFDAFREFRQHASGSEIPRELVASGRTGKELQLLEYQSLADVDLEGFDKNLPPNEIPSTKLLGATASESGLPTLSLSVDTDDLYHRNRGLLPNYQERGRGWERPAYMSYFNNGELRLASGVGLRVHGEKSRAARLKSFRLHFRELYGSADVSSDVFFDGPNDLMTSIIVHADTRNSRADKSGAPWQFMNPIAYEIAKEIGCITPDTKPIKFYMNGEYQGPYVLTEHLSDSFLKRRFGHDNFVLARMKWTKSQSTTGLQKGDPQLFDEYRTWPSKIPAPLTVDIVEKKIDLDNLTNWMISILYVGATDSFQGAVILDETDAEPRWRYINWDMDHAFMDLYDQVPKDWEIDNFTGVSAILLSETPRAIVFNRLRQESPEYRIKFLSRVVEVLNHVLTEEKVSKIITRYEEISRQFAMDDTSFFEEIKNFAKFRPAALRMQLDDYFGAGIAYQLVINNDLAMDITVDGYDIGAKYSGWYFSDTPVHIRVSPAGTTAVQTIFINGLEKKFGENDFTLRLSQDTEIALR